VDGASYPVPWIDFTWNFEVGSRRAPLP
jgi:hypothetical protein